MSEAPKDDTAATLEEKPEPTRTQDSPSYVIATVVVCLLLMVASTGVLVWSAVSASGADGSSAGQDAQERAEAIEQRNQVLELAETFLVEALSYDWRTIPEYKERVRPLLTEKNAADFERGVDEGLTAVVAETKLRQEVVFRVAAIKSMDADSAEVLVAGNGTSKSTLINRVFFPRLVVVMEKVDDAWLVASFQDLGDGSTVIS